MKSIRFAYGLCAVILTVKHRLGDSVFRFAEMGV